MKSVVFKFQNLIMMLNELWNIQMKDMYAEIVAQAPGTANAASDYQNKG